MDEWILITDEEPTLLEVVWLLLGSGAVKLGYIYCRKYFDAEAILNHPLQFKEVIAWQPVKRPNPPKK